MTREDLFAAIGQVEEQRLARCEEAPPSGIVQWEDDEMENKTTKRVHGRLLRNVLVAAVVVALLAASAFASWDATDSFDRYQLYENSQQVLEAAFGENRIACGEGNVISNEEFLFERVTVDEALARKYLVPYLYAVGEIWEENVVSKLDGTENFTKLTVEANLFDASTGCGVLYYTLEDNVGIDCQVCFDGSITGGDVLISANAAEYLDAAQTSENKLCVAVHYIVLGQETCVDLNCVGGGKICVPLVQRKLNHISIGNGKVTISPIGMRVENSIAIGCENADCIDEVRIQFADGTEYMVFGAVDGKEYGLDNRAYALGDGNNDQQVVYAFNRLVDVENIKSIFVNGVEYPVN